MKLEGLRVVDLSRFLPGPMLTQFMVDHGADVVKVESTTEGEPTRSIGERRDDVSVFFANTQRGKRSIALGLKQTAAVEAFMRLAERSDVVVESFRPGVADHLGVGYAQVSARAPHVVYVSISAFGQNGPRRNLAAHDLAIEAAAGVLSITRGQDGKPAIPGLPAADFLSSMMALSGVLMALLRRKETGRGDYLDIAMADCLLPCLGNNLGAAMSERRQVDVRAARSLGGNAMYALYETSDGQWIALGGQEPKFAANLLAALGRPDLIEVASLPPGSPQQPLREFLVTTFKNKSRADWAAFFDGRDVPYAPVRSLPEMLDDDAFRARGIVSTDTRGWDHIGNPIRFTDEPATERYELPALGEHTVEVLTEIGYSKDEIATLIAQSCARMASAVEIARYNG